MFHMKSRAGKAMVASVAAVGLVLSSFASQAQAFDFGDNDIVLAIFGNGTEALYNLGQRDTVFAAGVQEFGQNVLAGITAADGGPSGNPIRFTVFGVDQANELIQGGTTSPITAVDRTRTSQAIQLNVVGNWIDTPSAFLGDTIGKSDPNSYSTRIQFFSGPNPLALLNLGGTWGTQGVVMTGFVGDILNVLETGVGVGLSQIGRVQLTADGRILYGNPGPVSAVPLPGVVVLFGTGLVGLVGLARRSFSRKAA